MSHFRTLALRRTLRASTLDRLQMWLCDAILSSPDLRHDTTIAFRETDLAILPTDGQRLTLAISLQFCAVIYGVRSKRHPRATADLLELKSNRSSDVTPDAQAGDRHDPGDLEDADDPDEYFDVQLAFDREALRTFLVEVETENLTGYRLPDSLRAHATTLLQSEADLHPWFERAVLDLITAWEAERTLGETLESCHQPSDRQESERETDTVTSDSAMTPQKPDRDRISPSTENTGNAESETIEDEQSDIILVDILRDTISRARCFLQLDRLAIYQFSHSAEALKPAVRTAGSIVYEALVAPEMGSLQISTIVVRDFLPEGVQLDILDDPIAIDRVTSLSRSSRERQALESAQVQSQVIVPLRLRDRLWGVLFAQQCTQPRSWSQYDLDFLRYVAADMSLAIQQAHAVAELQQQKYMIEQAAEQQAHQLHDALQTTQAAKQTRTEFLSMMSHELRTPLACIIGMSSTLLRWSFGHLNDKQREYLKTIYDSGEHLLELIDDLLDLAELESGATQLKIAEFSLSQLARHIIRTAIDRATVNGIRLDLKLEIPADLDQFRADRARVNQILFNLLGNAIKFTLTGGQVTLRVIREAEQVVFAVEDTGIGIPQSQQASLFESFRQLDGTYTREYGGTGLGLALTKQLVELHHGTIDVQSEPDVGSCFTVCLPQAHEPALPDVTPPSTLRTAPHIPQGHIVLVTSREDDAMLVCDVLTAAGLQVIWMLDGSTALEQIRVLRPIVAIVDRRLDGIDGCELTSILRRSRETVALRIVMIGNGNQPEEESLCLMSGADRCVAAPLNLEALLTQVIELIELEDDRTAKVKVSPGQP